MSKESLKEVNSAALDSLMSLVDKMISLRLSDFFVDQVHTYSLKKDFVVPQSLIQSSRNSAVVLVFARHVAKCSVVVNDQIIVRESILKSIFSRMFETHSENMLKNTTYLTNLVEREDGLVFLAAVVLRNLKLLKTHPFILSADQQTVGAA